MNHHARKWIDRIEKTADGTAPLPAFLALKVNPLPVYLSYNGGMDWVQCMPLMVVPRQKGRPGYKFQFTELPCIGPPRGGLCFMLANEGKPYAHWTPRGGGHAESMGHCWFDSVRQELLRERPEHPASTSFMAARQWFAAQLRAACHHDRAFASAFNRFVTPAYPE